MKSIAFPQKNRAGPLNGKISMTPVFGSQTPGPALPYKSRRVLATFRMISAMHRGGTTRETF